jgi:uncharacterized membrane protein YfcA
MTSFIIIATAFLASLLTLFSGFGLGTILMPVVAIFFPVAVAVAMTAFVHLLNNLFKLTVLWKEINWPVVGCFGIPAMVATVPGAWLLTKLSDLPEIHSYSAAGLDASVTPVKLTVGLLLIFFATAEWLSIFKNVNLSRRTLPLGGILSGFFGGLSGHQGAFRSAFLLRAGLDKNQFVAGNVAIAVLVDITRLVVYGLSISPIMEQENMGLLAAATIAACAGALAGTVFLKKVTINFISKLVAVTLYILGALLTAGFI